MGDQFVFYLGCFMTIAVLIFVVLAPTCIMPLFNKFEPLEDSILKDDIIALAEDCEYPCSAIEMIDGSKRSSHSNAF
jgi:STE24 endopeptidase